MPYTDIVKARAIRRAGRACEMCGAPLTFRSARFVSAHPIFGVLLDRDDCCVLCGECLDELDPETRAAVEDRPLNEGETTAEEGSDAAGGHGSAGAEDGAERRDRREVELPRAARETRPPTRRPDGDICA